jgi:hypothetical protein
VEAERTRDLVAALAGGQDELPEVLGENAARAAPVAVQDGY